MENKNDWDELEKWNTQRIIDEKEKSKFYFEEFSKNKKIDTFVKGLKVGGSVFKLITFIIILIIVFISGTLLNMYLSNIRSKYTIDVIPTIQNMYNIKVKVISKDIDEEEDGIYRLQVKKNKDIQFTAIKKGNAFDDDFLDRSHKYYFNKWSSENKQKFRVNEIINNELLKYETYIEISNYEEIEEAVNVIFEFEEFCLEKYFGLWDIYLIKENKRIYPYHTNAITKEEAINYSKELYKQLFTL